MTVRALFLCDDAPMPADFQIDASIVRKSINWRSSSSDLNLRAENLWETVLDAVDGRAADLIRIASCVYGADQEVSRGGRADIYGEDWRRQMHMVIPVADVPFWSDETVRRSLETTLDFLTGDTWRFWFSPFRGGPHQLTLEPGDRALLGHPDCVVLFSGGADSLCATVELMTRERVRPLLVSHRPSPARDNRQRHLVRLLREDHRERPEHISFWVHRKGRDASDTSQRSRAFLFASLGAALAGQLRIPRVVLPDNGVISVNLPINAQLAGTLASRSTHPRFIWHFNRLLESMFEIAVRVENTLEFRTRPEVLAILRAVGREPLLQESVSCSHPRGSTTVQPHCGYCSQCVDRRFGSIAAGLEEHDPGERYRVDIFTDALVEGEPLTTGESYLRFARWLTALDPEQLFLEWPQLADAIAPDSPRVAEAAEALATMYRRHGEAIVRVLGAMIGRHRDELAAGSLPETCLLRLATGSTGRPAMSPDRGEPTLPEFLFRREGRLRRIHFEGHETIVEDSVGMRQLARLLCEPNQDFDVLELSEPSSPRHGKALPREDRNALTTSHREQAVLDSDSMDDYQSRLRELSAAREAAERVGDQIELAQIDHEYEAIERHLAETRALGGRSRNFQSDRGKAWQRVRRTIKDAIAKIGEVHPDLGRHLDHAVHTGWFCAYRPENDIRWVV